MNWFIVQLFLYTTLVVVYYFFSRKPNHFKTKTSWWKNGFSLFAVNFSITTPLVYSEVVHSEGFAGLWLFFCAYAISGFLPFVFAPLWAKLSFITDNQFLLFRFSGKGAKVLHIFRTIYVGWAIVAFLMSFHLLAFLKVLVFITSWDKDTSFLILAVFLIAIALKNKLGANIQLDFFNTILIIFVFILILIFLFIEPVSENYTYEKLFLSPILPNNKWDLCILFFIQTWSVNLFDGSGIEAQRFFSTKGKNNAWKVAVLSNSLSLVFSVIFVLINYLGVNKIGLPNLSDKAIFILFYVQEGTPSWFLPFVMIAFLATFITSFAGFLNWGASFLTIDGYKTYLKPKANQKQLAVVSTLSMLLIVLTSLGITYFSESLLFLTKILFSISAGVAPVFVLRWFWLRINAWSQLSAMVGSGIYTLLYQNFITESIIEKNWQALTSLNTYSIQLMVVTSLTSITWLIITFTTPKDNLVQLEKFRLRLFSAYPTKTHLFKAFIFGFFLVLVLFLSMKVIEKML